MNLNSEYWESRYQDQTTRWDLGEISNPIKEYIDQLDNKTLSILIPGGGNSYEAEYMFNKGFSNVYVLDIAITPLNNIKNRIPLFPSSQLIEGDFFDLKMSFDLIIEQTFFCALKPSLRPTYAKKMSSLLNENGKLVGLMFDAPLYTEHPPFGGNRAEYFDYFDPFFVINIMEPATNSIPDRLGRELFINLSKKN